MEFRGGGATRKSAPDGNLIRYNSVITPKVILNKFQNLKKYRYAFTLAEVLITLGIIGIVTAMTLPSLIGNYQKKQMAMQLKKVYSLMQQALQRAEVDYEAFEYWDFTLSGSDFSDRYIKPYYKILQIMIKPIFLMNIILPAIKAETVTVTAPFQLPPK